MDRAECRSDPGRRRTVIAHSPPNNGGSTLVNLSAAEIISPQAYSDDRLIELWVHGRSRHTARAYRADARRLLVFTGLPLREMTLGDLQAFADALGQAGLQLRSTHRILSAVKSLFAFGHRLGYLPFDTARPLRLPTLRDELSERILDEGQVQRLLASERNPRNRAILLLLYSSGVRVSELCGLRWRDCQPRDGGGQITVFGKGGRTRSIRVPSSVWELLVRNGLDVDEDDPVFRSRKGLRPLSPSQVTRVVRRAAQRAGIPRAVTAHWLRHAHASHALDRHAPIHLVQQTLGHASVATTSRYLHARPGESSSSYLPL